MTGEESAPRHHRYAEAGRAVLPGGQRDAAERVGRVRRPRVVAPHARQLPALVVGYRADRRDDAVRRDEVSVLPHRLGLDLRTELRAERECMPRAEGQAPACGGAAPGDLDDDPVELGHPQLVAAEGPGLEHAVETVPLEDLVGLLRVIRPFLRRLLLGAEVVAQVAGPLHEVVDGEAGFGLGQPVAQQAKVTSRVGLRGVGSRCGVVGVRGVVNGGHHRSLFSPHAPPAVPAHGGAAGRAAADSPP